MRVIHYPRVSSREQLKGDSIDAQINRLKQHSEDNDDEVVGIYTDAGKSASISEDKITISFRNGRFIIGIDLAKRPAMRKLIEEAPLDKFEGIKFTRWDRYSRNMILSKILQIYFGNHNIKLIPTDDSNDPLMVQIKGALSEEEIRVKNERVRFSRLERFNKGQMVGRAPVGYKFNPTKKVMEVDKKKARIVKEAFRMTLEGKYWKDICKALKLKPQSYYNIIRNKVYMGIVCFENEEKVGVHEPLVDKDTWEKINSIPSKHLSQH